MTAGDSGTVSGIVSPGRAGGRPGLIAEIVRRLRLPGSGPATVTGVAAAVAASLLLAGCTATVSGTSTQRQAISRALVTADGRQVVVPVTGGGCVQRSILTATETASRVTVVLQQILSGSVCAADASLGTAAVVLRHPLCGRALVDGTSGHRIPYFDGRTLLRVTYLPAGYRFSNYFPAGGWERWFVSADQANGPLIVVQVPGRVAASPTWPVQFRAEVDGRPAAVHIGSDNGQAYGRAISWTAGGDTFAVYSLIMQAGQQPLGVAALTRIAAGLRS